MSTNRSKYNSPFYSDDFLDLQPAELRKKLIGGSDLKNLDGNQKKPQFRLKYLRLGPYIIRTNYEDEKVEQGVKIIFSSLITAALALLICTMLFAVFVAFVFPILLR